ncbi:hypothetical protein V1511DRAFT_122006 [Dipodascopsis uninucleata]
MARLAEQPAMETIDSVKRRFLRQNRELARINSNHSSRISNLESKISALLAENLELRQQVITLQHGHEKWISKKCFDIKKELQNKMREVEHILDEFKYETDDNTQSMIPEEEENDDELPGIANISTRKRSSSARLSLSAYNNIDDEKEDADNYIEENRCLSPQAKDSRKFAPEELSASEIPESPNMGTDLNVPEIILKDGMHTVRPARRKRRDSLHELDIVSMVKAQNASYKAKISQTVAPQQSSSVEESQHAPTVEDVHMEDPGVNEGVVLTDISVASETENRDLETEIMLPSNTRSSSLSSSKSKVVGPTRISRRSLIAESESRQIVNDSESSRIETEDMHTNSIGKPSTKIERRALQQKNTNLETQHKNVHTKKTSVIKELKSTEPSSDQAELLKEIDGHNILESDQQIQSPEGSRRYGGRARKNVNYALPSLRAKMRREHDQFVDAIVVIGDQGNTGQKAENDVEKNDAVQEIKIKQEESQENADFEKIPVYADQPITKVKQETALQTRKRRGSSSISQSQIESLSGRSSQSIEKSGKLSRKKSIIDVLSTENGTTVSRRPGRRSTTGYLEDASSRVTNSEKKDNLDNVLNRVGDVYDRIKDDSSKDASEVSSSSLSTSNVASKRRRSMVA